MSMVALYLLPCCKRKVSFGRFIPPEDAVNRPEMNCPLCGKRIKLSRDMGELYDEKIHKVKHPFKYVLPLKDGKEDTEDTDLLW